MSDEIKYQWEWPADRSIEKRILVKIGSIKEKSSGLFGVEQSPSLAASLPDPRIIKGTILKSDSNLTGREISIVVPSLEIGEVKENSYAVFGIVDEDTCICIVPVPSEETDINSVNCDQ